MSEKDAGADGPAIAIEPARADEIELVRRLFREYADWLAVDLCFQDFEAELAGLPGKYRPPAGGIWLARVDGAVAGCVANRPLEPGSCEMKRLWVRDAYRGLGLGWRLAVHSVEAARGAGHRRLRLDTLERLTAARHIYERLGFRETGAYYDNPLDDVVYLELDLEPDRASRRAGVA